jgi:hypothetical protein
MADDTEITGLDELAGTDLASDDLFPMVDVDDASQDAEGTNKGITAPSSRTYRVSVTSRTTALLLRRVQRRRRCAHREGVVRRGGRGHTRHAGAACA